ncbi:DUF998 domain-containing protein [Sphaerisporangium sp. TRM90804]|uniref:DUF998 domain-containing protein n=1 Tax=Sphaerisporangium sp. TRM90804 TaxID=3031113 RepID=UPI002448DD3A|nr:DUF998 domain-containing protein [Sphaerisporangium sp. TRM90804]MDH2429108.1 DUF998 domain-containing protein [Sphaerisporangium sp. TRM90804]
MRNRLMTSGYAALAGGAAAMITLHAVSGLDPLRDMISEYAYNPHGWLLAVSLGLFAAGSALLAGELARRGVRPSTVVLVGVWSCCMVMIAAFPTDRPGMSLSMSGGIHRYAALAAFLCMPLAGWAVAARGGGGRTRLLRALSLAAGGFLLLVVTPYAVRMLGLDPGAIPAGLTQRLVVVTEVIILALMALPPRRATAHAARATGVAARVTGMTALDTGVTGRAARAAGRGARPAAAAVVVGAPRPAREDISPAGAGLGRREAVLAGAGRVGALVR